MRFDWDPKKAASNYEKHGVRFVDAITVFDDPYVLIAPDADHSTGSEVRAANRKEKKKYGESKRVSI